MRPELWAVWMWVTTATVHSGPISGPQQPCKLGGGTFCRWRSQEAKRANCWLEITPPRKSQGKNLNPVRFTQSTCLGFLRQAFVVVRLLSSVWLYNLMDCSTPGSSILHCLLEFAQIYVHWIRDADHLILWLPPPPFSFYLQAFPVSRLFPVSQLFPSGGQSLEAALPLVFPMNIQGWFPLGLTSLISL